MGAMAMPFTDEEKRFLLGEMIKTSHLDVESLSRFIKTSGIEPNWMHMQLPRGRNMMQCMQASDHMHIEERGSTKRKYSDDLSEHRTKKMALNRLPDSPAATAAQGLASTHVAILPRPSSRSADAPLAPVSAPAPPPVPPAVVRRKRGRPSRADKAKSLHPSLPQAIAPRPTEQTRSSPVQRAILPATSPTQITAAPLQSANANSTDQGQAAHLEVQHKVEGQTDDRTRPRVMAERVFDRLPPVRPISAPPGLPPLEPDPRHIAASQGHVDEFTTLPPMIIDRGRRLPSINL